MNDEPFEDYIEVVNLLAQKIMELEVELEIAYGLLHYGSVIYYSLMHYEGKGRFN